MSTSPNDAKTPVPAALPVPLLTIVVLAGAMLLPPGVPGADWHQWLGPDRNGVTAERGWDERWSEGEPEEAWRAELGTGFSSVAISDGRLYSLGHAGGRETVYCLDAATGKEVWKHSYECDLVDNLHEGGPAATPTVDGDLVYTMSREGHLFCFRKASGEVVWLRELQHYLGVKLPEWGFASSPLILGEKVIFDAGPLVALHKGTGKIIWKTKAYRCGYGSPVAFEVGRRRYVAALNNDGLLVADPEDGAVVDLFEWRSQYATSSTTPVVEKSSLFISTGYRSGCALLLLKGAKLRSVYRNRNMSNHMNNSVLYKGHLYGFDGNEHARSQVRLVCLDHRTGKVRWRERGLGCGSLTIAGDRLVILGDRGELVIARASPRGFSEISRRKVLDGKCWTIPVLNDGRIYCRSVRGRLVCLDVRGKRG